MEIPSTAAFRVDVRRTWFGFIRVSLQGQYRPGRWMTIDRYYTRSLYRKPKNAHSWVWDFLIQIGVLGVPVFVENDWSPAFHEQSIDRLHRSGVEKPEEAVA